MSQTQEERVKRDAKWFDDVPNKYIRTQITDNLKITATEAAERLKASGVEITAEAVRQWCGGYSRPDISKLKSVADALGCSCNYLLGVSDTPAADNETIRERLGLDDAAIANLERMRKESPEAINALIGSKYFWSLTLSLCTALEAVGRVDSAEDFEIFAPGTDSAAERNRLLADVRKAYGSSAAIIGASRDASFWLHNVEMAFHELLYNHPSVKKFKELQREYSIREYEDD